MKRLAFAFAVALALGATAAMTPGPAAAASCDSWTIGQFTDTQCSGPNGAYSSTRSQQIGDFTYSDTHGRDAYGNPISSRATSQQIGDFTHTDISRDNRLGQPVGGGPLGSPIGTPIGGDVPVPPIPSVRVPSFSPSSP